MTLKTQKWTHIIHNIAAIDVVTKLINFSGEWLENKIKNVMMKSKQFSVFFQNCLRITITCQQQPFSWHYTMKERETEGTSNCRYFSKVTKVHFNFPILFSHCGQETDLIQWQRVFLAPILMFLELSEDVIHNKIVRCHLENSHTLQLQVCLWLCEKKNTCPVK